MMGKPQKLVHTQAVHKIWHLIIGALEKLDYESDAQLQKFFNDMIIKWIPQFNAVCISYSSSAMHLRKLSIIKHHSLSLFLFLFVPIDNEKKYPVARPKAFIQAIHDIGSKLCTDHTAKSAGKNDRHICDVTAS